MRVLCFSSFTFSYLDRARVLYASLRRHHPDWHLVALITDEPPAGFEFEPENEPWDEVVWSDQLGVPNYRSWLFKHDVVEVCTAVKGPYLAHAVTLPYDAVVYLDPDIALFHPLTTVLEALETKEVVLTPHLLDFDNDPVAVQDNEISALRCGVYNLGFVAVRTQGEGVRFANWWSDRLLEYCFDDIPTGLFVDQRWCDHVPALFERVHVLRDPGCNVASWNINTRRVSVERTGAVLVNGSPLKFWHFTKLGPVGDAMTRKYAGDNFEVHEIWRWYHQRAAAAYEPAIPARYWAYGTYSDGATIPKAQRVIYRKRPDLRSVFPDPFASGSNSLQAWFTNNPEA